MNAAGFVELSHPSDPRYLMVRGSLLEVLPNAPATLTSEHIFGGIYGRPMIYAPEHQIVARYECPDPEAGVWYLRAFVKEQTGRCSKCGRECDPVTDCDSATVICADCAGAS